MTPSSPTQRQRSRRSRGRYRRRVGDRPDPRCWLRRSPWAGKQLEPRGQPEQSTATSRAAQMARIRVSASRPSRLTNTAIETLSTESRFTAERRGTGSVSGSRTTSLASPRMVVVQGATSARRRRGIAASRDSTTTGRRRISAISHHHTSPRAGSALTKPQPLGATTLGRPTRRARRTGARRRPHSWHPPRPIDGERVARREPHR